MKLELFIGTLVLVFIANIYYEGKIRENPIHGHGTNKEIKELRDEGFDVVNIPWISDDH